MKTVDVLVYNESVSDGRLKLIAGPLGGLPDSRIRIVITDDGEESFAFAGLSGLLVCADGGKTRIVI